MKRFLAAIAGFVFVLLITAPVQAAAPPLTTSDRVVVIVNGDVTIAATETANAVFVVDGNARIEGTVNSVTVLGGHLTMVNAHATTVTVIDTTADLQAGTRIDGDLIQLNGTITRADGVVIGGATRSLGETVAGFAVFLGFAAIAIWIGAALTMLLAGVVLAGLAARQVRTAEAIISREPLKTVVVGLLMAIVPPVAIVLLAITIIGLPLSLTLLFLAFPLVTMVGYLVASIWIGDWLLRAAGRRVPAERPYLAAVVGLIVSGFLGLIPLVSLVVSVFGLGAVTIAAWRTLAGGQTAQPTYQPMAAPMGA